MWNRWWFKGKWLVLKIREDKNFAAVTKLIKYVYLNSNLQYGKFLINRFHSLCNK